MKIKYWIKAFRLRTLPLSISSILMAFSLANIHFSLETTVLLLAIVTTIFLQILSNLANDYGDGIKGSDVNRVGEPRMVSAGFISESQMLVGVIIFSILSFISGSYLLYFVFGFADLIYSLLFLSLGLFSIWGAIKYTMGKNPYGYSGYGDLFVFIFFGLLGVFGSYFLFTKTLEPIAISGALICGCLSVCVLNMNNMRDYYSDKKVGKITLVVKKGIKWAANYQLVLISIAIISYVSVFLYTINYWLFIGLIPIAILLTNVKTALSFNENSELDGELKKIALSTFAIAIILFFSIS